MLIMIVAAFLLYENPDAAGGRLPFTVSVYEIFVTKL
jgi:hypothetical protein